MIKYYALYNSGWHCVYRCDYDSFCFKGSTNVLHKFIDYEIKEIYK